MSVEQLKREITILTDTEQNEVTAFLFHLRHRNDAAYREMDDTKASDLDSLLDQRESAIAAGTAKDIDWEDAKREILEAVR